MKNFVLIGILTLFLITVAAYTNFSPKERQEESIKIGVILPLSGNAAKSGEDSLAAIEIARNDLKEKYPNIELVVEDSGFSSAKTISAYNKLVSADEVVGIIGGLNSSAVEAIKPVAKQSQVVMLSPGGAASTIGEYVYKNSHEASKEGGEVAQFAFDRGDRTAAVLFMNNDFGEIEKKSFVDTFRELGGEITSVESFDITGSTDYRTQITKVKNTEPDAVLIVSLGGLVGTASKQIKELGLDANLYGIYTTESSDLLDVGGESLEGLVYSFPIAIDATTQEQEKFVNAFYEKTGRSPQLLSYNAYDWYSMLIPIVVDCEENSVCIRDAIAARSTLTGLGGQAFIKDENGGKVIDRPFYFRQVQDGKIVEVSSTKE